MEVTINQSNLSTITGKLDDVRSAVSNIKITVNASFSNAQEKFQQALNGAVDQSLRLASTKYGAFWTQTVTKMQTDVSSVERKLGNQITKVQTVTQKLATSSSASAIDFEKQRLAVMNRQANLMSKQEQSFSNFKFALSQAAEQLMTLPRLISDSDKATEQFQIVNMTRTQRETYAVTHDLMSNLGVNEGVGNAFYINTLAPLIKSKYEEPDKFKEHILVQLAIGQHGDASILKPTDEQGKPFDEVEIEKRIFGGIAKRLAYAEQMQHSKNPEKQKKGIFLEKEIKDAVNGLVVNNSHLAAVITDPGSSKYLQKRKKNVTSFVNAKDPGRASGRDADLKNHNFYNTLKTLDDFNKVFDLYYNTMEGLLKQFPDLIAVAKGVSAFGLAIAGVIPIVNGLYGGFSNLFKILQGGGLIQMVKSGVGQAWNYGKGGVRNLVTGEGGLAGVIRGLSSSELLATGGEFSLRASPWLMALALKGDTMQTPEELEKEIKYKRQNAVKELKGSQQEVSAYEKRFGEKVNYYDDHRGFVLENQFGGATILGSSLELVKHTIHELEANKKKTEAVEKATGLQLTFSAPSKHFVLINKKGQIVYDIGKKLNASQEDMIKGAQDAQKPSKWYPPNWFSSSTSKTEDPKGKLEPILRTAELQSSPVFAKQSVNNRVPNFNISSDVRHTNGPMAAALQWEKQLVNTTQNIMNNDQRFNFNIHLASLTNDFNPIKQWFQHELPTILKNIKSPVTVSKASSDRTLGLY